MWWVRDFPGGSDGKASVYNTGDLGSIPGLGRSPGEGNGYPLQYPCLENPVDGGAWHKADCKVIPCSEVGGVGSTLQMRKLSLNLGKQFAGGHTGGTGARL